MNEGEDIVKKKVGKKENGVNRSWKKKGSKEKHGRSVSRTPSEREAPRWYVDQAKTEIEKAEETEVIREFISVFKERKRIRREANEKIFNSSVIDVDSISPEVKYVSCKEESGVKSGNIMEVKSSASIGEHINTREDTASASAAMQNMSKQVCVNNEKGQNDAEGIFPSTMDMTKCKEEKQEKEVRIVPSNSEETVRMKTEEMGVQKMMSRSTDEATIDGGGEKNKVDGKILERKEFYDVMLRTIVSIKGGHMGTEIVRNVVWNSIGSIVAEDDLTDEAVDLLIQLCSHVPLETDMGTRSEETRNKCFSWNKMVHNPYDFKWIVQYDGEDVHYITDELEGGNHENVETLLRIVKNEYEAPRPIVEYCNDLCKIYRRFDRDRSNPIFNDDLMIIPLLGNDHWSCAVLVGVSSYINYFLKSNGYNGPQEEVTRINADGCVLRIYWMDSAGSDSTHLESQHDNISLTLFNLIWLKHRRHVRNNFSYHKFKKGVTHFVVKSRMQRGRDCGVYCAYNINIAMLLEHQLRKGLSGSEFQTLYDSITWRILPVGKYRRVMRLTMNYILQTVFERMECGEFEEEYSGGEVTIPALGTLTNWNTVQKKILQKMYEKMLQKGTEILCALNEVK